MFSTARLVRRPSKPGLLFAVIALLAGLFLNLSTASVAQAATFTIADGDVAGLIAAINTANGNGQANIINLAPGGTYTLTVADNATLGGTGLPVITSDLTINGNGATLQRNNTAATPLFRILYVSPTGNLKLNQLTVRYGLVDDNGSCLYNQGKVTVTESTFTVCGTNGLKNGPGFTYIEYVGGAIDSEAGSSLNVIGSTFSHNRASIGAGIAASGDLSVTSSIFLSNTAETGLWATYPGVGGGILLTKAGVSPVTILNSTFAGNYAYFGGAIQNAGRDITVINSTFIAGYTSYGPHISGIARIYNNYFSDNFQGGCAAYVVAGSNNLELGDRITCGSAATTTLLSSSPLVGTLANNGGPTETFALKPPPNPAIDGGNPAYCPATDQRGVPRVGICDVGAYEYGTATAPVTPVAKPVVQPADIVAQLRVNPDRYASLDPENLITYNLSIKNAGQGKAGSVSIRFPIDPALSVGYATFSDQRMWVKAIVTDTDQPYILIGLPSLEAKGTALSATLVFRPSSKASAGTSVSSRYQVLWDDDAGTGKQQNSNGVHFTFSSDGSNRNDSSGDIQLFDPPTAQLVMGGSVKLSGDFYTPNEQVSLWYTDKNGVSVSLGTQAADKDGKLSYELSSQGLKAGEVYAVAGRGSRSELTGTAVVSVVASS